MNEPLINDVLSWNKFNNESSKEITYPPKKIDLFNRLVAHTNHFFIISAIGAFTPGYLMLISKKLVPSFSLIDEKHMDELKWLLSSIKSAIGETYDRKTIEFEHGMCNCVGGLDRAHIHLMTVSKDADDELIKNSINKTLIKRKAGINSVEINACKLENIHDILEVMSSKDSEEYKINGKQLLYKDIYNDLDLKKWPFSARDHVNSGGHYVYFNTNSNISSFFTSNNFQTQLGRQIVYEVELETNDRFKSMSDEVLKKNNYANIWKWQEFSFKDNMLKTMNDIIPAISKIKKDIKSKSYNFQAFDKK